MKHKKDTRHRRKCDTCTRDGIDDKKNNILDER